MRNSCGKSEREKRGFPSGIPHRNFSVPQSWVQTRDDKTQKTLDFRCPNESETRDSRPWESQWIVMSDENFELGNFTIKSLTTVRKIWQLPDCEQLTQVSLNYSNIFLPRPTILRRALPSVSAALHRVLLTATDEEFQYDPVAHGVPYLLPTWRLCSWWNLRWISWKTFR